VASFEQRWSALEPSVIDRRQEPPPVLEFGRAFDPMPLSQSIGGTPWLHAGYETPPMPSGPPSKLARQLGANELQLLDLLNRIGIRR
jgi:hypothetical protein